MVEEGRDTHTGILTTPFRAHLDHCRALDTKAMLVECADYIQHVELLVSEFLESYYLVERLWQPSSELTADGDEAAVRQLLFDAKQEAA